MSDDGTLLERLKDVRKRRGAYRSTERSSLELTRLRSLLPQESVERELFELAEVSGLSYKAIAGRMNLSERHVYRLRKRMIEMLAAGEAYASAAQRATSEPGLGLVRMLLKYGKYKEAEEAASRLERAGLTPQMGVELLSLKAITACERGRRPEATVALGQAMRLAESVDRNALESCERRTVLAEAHLSYHEGFYETTIERYERALRGWTARALECDEAAALARDLIALGVLHQEGGSPERALEVLDEAERILQRLPNPSYSDVADVHIHRAFAAASLPNRLEDARKDAERALNVAGTHGLAAEYVWANLACGILNELLQKPTEALRDARHALDLARAVLSGGPLARTHFISSRIEIYANELDGTLDHLREARDLTQEDSLLGMVTDLVEARVHRAAGNAKATVESASLAIENFQRRRTSTHYLGEAYLARAIAGHALGRDARDDADAAVALLRRGGWISDQDRALKFAAEVHGRTA